jgi:rhombotail lipoprotein
VYSSKNLFLVLPLLLCGCAQGFDRAALQDRLNDGSIQTNDQDIAAARAMKPQLRFPCRMAVYFKPGDHDWRWTTEDRAALETCAKQLKAEGIASEVFPLPEMLVGKDTDVKCLRLAAAKCGADVLFIIHGAAQTDSYKNAASVFDLTIVGGYLVPGSHKDSLFMMEGLLIDVDNGFIYTGVQSEGVGKIIRPTFRIEEKDAIARAKTKAITDFGEEVVQRLRRLAASPPPSSAASDVNWKKAADGLPPVVSDINRQGAIIGPTPAATHAPDLDVPNVKGPHEHR